MAKAKTGHNLLKPILDKIPAPIRNKYFLVLAIFVFWMIFISKADVMTQYKLNQSRQNLEFDKQYYIDKISETKEQKRVQEEDIEKFAREKYYFQKDGEDVFIMEEPEK